MPIGPSGAASGAISNVTVTGTAANGQVPVASSSTAGVWGYPPGFEINYTQITATVNVASTTESSGTTIISPGAITFDGTPVMVEFFGIFRCDTAAATDIVVVSLFEGATQITELGVLRTVTATSPSQASLCLKYRFTPTAASHTYTVTAFASSTTGVPQILAGTGGTGANPPTYIRFTKV